MDQKSKLTKLKKQRDKVDKTCQELKQDTGIVSNSSMKEDHEKRELQNKELVELIYQKKQHHQMLKDQIKLARQYQTQQFGNNMDAWNLKSSI